MEMNLVCMVKKRGVDTLAVNVTAANTDHATFIKNIPGVGKPFLLFTSLPGKPLAADFDLYPEYVVSADTAENQALIDAQLATPPLDALTF